MNRLIRESDNEFKVRPSSACPDSADCPETIYFADRMYMIKACSIQHSSCIEGFSMAIYINGF